MTNKDWRQALTNEAQSPLFKFIIEIVESTLAENEEFPPRRETTKELESIKNENKKLRNYLRQKDIVIERYESELECYRSEVFLSPSFEF